MQMFLEKTNQHRIYYNNPVLTKEFFKQLPCSNEKWIDRSRIGRTRPVKWTPDCNLRLVDTHRMSYLRRHMQSFHCFSKDCWNNLCINRLGLRDVRQEVENRLERIWALYLFNKSLHYFTSLRYGVVIRLTDSGEKTDQRSMNGTMT